MNSEIYVLPFPPSVNHYWRNFRGRMVISKAGRLYKQAVAGYFIAHAKPLYTGRIGVEVVACSPDRRRRDLDNTAKALLDAMAHAGVYEDDSQIDHLIIRRGEVVKDGLVQVKIWNIGKAGSNTICNVV